MKKNILLIIIFLITSSCGFKVINQSELVNFSIAEIITSGDKRINYKIKNKLLFLGKDSEKQVINLNLVSEKIKSIKERNIKNEITKFQILINLTIKIEGNKIDELIEFTLSSNGDYSISKQHSQTLTNEKKLIELLSSNLADRVLQQIIFKLNDI